MFDALWLRPVLWFREGGRDRYEEYLTAAAPLVEAAGGRFVTPRFLPQVAYDDDVVPDVVLLGSYPFLDAVIAMVTDPTYRQVGALCTEAVAHSATTVLRVD